ncbi:hypothetical protein LCGC14_3132050 [marine sediment metagenome]|uniref:Uncharacterized protein n=1 Tax=marine sediment metagenome TaxID=412755 RepID=A0A0F8VZE0_9ZZZZ
MNISLSISYRGHRLLLTMDVINISSYPAEWDIGLPAGLDNFEVEEIWVTSAKGMRLPSDRLDNALHELVKGKYSDGVSEAVLNSLGGY